MHTPHQHHHPHHGEGVPVTVQEVRAQRSRIQAQRDLLQRQATFYIWGVGALMVIFFIADNLLRSRP